MARLRVALCQINTTVGDLDGNVDRVIAALEGAEDRGCDLAVFPELALTGYPPEDLLLKPGFVGDNRRALDRVARASGACAAVVGFVDVGRDLYNAAAVCAFGQVQAVYHKRNLPNYAVFDEQRYFAPGTGLSPLVEVAGVRVGVSICEDAFSPTGPIATQAAGGAELVVNINASPYYADRLVERERMLATRASDASCALVYVNQVGGQDELVFDGASMIFDAHGGLVARAGQFREETLVCDVEVLPVFRKRLLDPRGRITEPSLPVIDVSSSPRVDDPGDVCRGEVTDALPPVQEVYEALVTGTRDYVHKNGFTDVAIALSGGIDSSLVAAIAADAVGPDHVHGVLMPSRYSSDHSLSDAEKLAGRARHRAPGDPDRARPRRLPRHARTELRRPRRRHHRGEPAVARPRRGDDGPVQQVPRLAGADHRQQERDGGRLLDPLRRHRRRVRGHQGRAQAARLRAVPRPQRPGRARAHPRVGAHEAAVGRAAARPARRPVTAARTSCSTRSSRRTSRTTAPRAELVGMGFDADVVERITRLVDTAEYKRRQTPPGVRVTPKAFGKDRRVPITNRYRG